MKKLKTTSVLSIRSGSPDSTGDNKVGELPIGFEIQIDREIQGEEIEGNTLWYQDINGFYYWSGGFKKNDTMDINIQSNKEPAKGIPFEPYVSERYSQGIFQNVIDYNEVLNIPSTIKGGGDGVVPIGLLDSHCLKSHESLEGAFLNGSQLDMLNDHGTKMAGIIAGRGLENSGVRGVVPKSKIVEYRVTDSAGWSSSQIILDVFGRLKTDGIMAINVSQSFHEPDIQESVVRPEIELIASEIPVVASAGEDEQLLTLSQGPAYYDNVISVGSITPHKIGSEELSELDRRLDFLVPNFEFVFPISSNEGSYIKQFGQDSTAAAVVTGIIGLILLKRNSSTRPDILQILNSISIPYSKANKSSLTLIKPNL